MDRLQADCGDAAMGGLTKSPLDRVWSIRLQGLSRQVRDSTQLDEAIEGLAKDREKMSIDGVF